MTYSNFKVKKTLTEIYSVIGKIGNNILRIKCFVYIMAFYYIMTVVSCFIYTENIEKNMKMQCQYKRTIKFVRVHFFVCYEND
jgi:hypothetical protein